MRDIKLVFDPFPRRQYPGDTEMMEPELSVPTRCRSRMIFSVTPAMARLIAGVPTLEDLLAIQGAVADRIATEREIADARASE